MNGKSPARGGVFPDDCIGRRSVFAGNCCDLARATLALLAATLLALGSGCASSSAPPAKVDGADSSVDGQGEPADPCAGKTCDDNLSCTEDKCVAGSCENTLKADACLIDGACYAKGQGDGATASCNVCNPSQSTSAWTADAGLCADDGKSCTDAKCVAGKCEHEVQLGFCLVSGACYQDGAADPNNECRSCDSSNKNDDFSAKSDGTACTADALTCTDDTCQSGKCEHPVKSGSCLVGGACYSDGEVNPQSDCQGCDAGAEQLAWSTRADGSSCGDDGLACTDDTCQSGACSHPLKSNACLISGSCFAANDTNPQAECQQCNPGTSTSAWTNKAGGTACTSDGLTCTSDVCGAGVCTHPVAANTCLISGSCYSDGDNHPGVQCRRCIASQSNTQWSVTPDGVSCADDTLSCTDDRCSAGSCTHPVKAGQCLIGTTCYDDQQQVGGATSCSTCLPSVSQTAATFTDGRACDDSDTTTIADTCLAGVCAGFSGYIWEWSPSDTDTSINDVIEGVDGKIWVAGSFVDGFAQPRGLMASLNGQVVSNLSLVPQPMRSLHHRVAVGDSGTTRWFSGVTWINPGIGSWGTTNLSGVWGSTFGATDVHFISGDGALQRCETQDGNVFNCTSHSGFGTDSLRRVFGTLTSTNAQDRLWAIRGAVQEDIYSAAAGSTVWSKAAPTGCTDSSGAPCGNTPGRLYDLWARDAGEAWAVGDAGLVLRYDGSGWTNVQIPTLAPALGPPQTNYVFRGVHGSGDLVFLVGERNVGNLFWDLIVIIYNRSLDRWYKPRFLGGTTFADPRRTSWRLNAVGGPLNNIYFVGSQYNIGQTQQMGLHYAR